jgi:formiminotetrahydrofolate cyclodeaminase
MAEKIVIELFRNKNMDELTQALANPDSKLETGSGAAAVAAAAAALVCRAAAITAKSQEVDERLDYIQRNVEILRNYMVHMIDEDVKCRAPLNRAIREGDKVTIEAARQPATSICGEIINMMGKLLELAVELSPRCPKEAKHYLTEAAEIALSACRSAKAYIVDMSSYCTDETYRFVVCRENELLIQQYEELIKQI